jgi:hypothetical protein
METQDQRLIRHRDYLRKEITYAIADLNNAEGSELDSINEARRRLHNALAMTLEPALDNA